MERSIFCFPQENVLRTVDEIVFYTKNAFPSYMNTKSSSTISAPRIPRTLQPTQAVMDDTLHHRIVA